MDFWGQALAQFVGEMGAGAILLTIGLYLENWLDERRSARHDVRTPVVEPVVVVPGPAGRTPPQTSRIRLMDEDGVVQLGVVTATGRRPVTVRERTGDGVMGVFHPVLQAADGDWIYRRMSREAP